jgi:hypothetical protein
MHILVDILGWRIQLGAVAERLSGCDHEEQQSLDDCQRPHTGEGSYL